MATVGPHGSAVGPGPNNDPVGPSQAAGGGVTGSLAATEAKDVLEATGTVLVAGDLAVTEALDVLAATGTVLVSGDLDATETADTFAATGTAGIAGSLDATETTDTFAADGTVLVAGDLAATEATDVLAATGTVLVAGDLDATEAADVLAAVGTVLISGDLDATEAPDVFAASGGTGHFGDLAATESPDLFEAAGTVLVAGDLDATEAVDTFAATGTVLIAGDLDATEGRDTFAGAGAVTVAGDLDATEGADIFAATGGTADFGDLAATEATDVLAATGTVLVSGDLDATEGSDTVAATGTTSRTGTLAATEAKDVFSASGSVSSPEVPTVPIIAQGSWYPQQWTFKHLINASPNMNGFIQCSPYLGKTGAAWTFIAPATGRVKGFGFHSYLLQGATPYDLWGMSIYSVGSDGLPSANLGGCVRSYGPRPRYISLGGPYGLSGRWVDASGDDWHPDDMVLTAGQLYAAVLEAVEWGVLSVFGFTFPLGAVNQRYFPRALQQTGGMWSTISSADAIPSLALYYPDENRWRVPFGCMPVGTSGDGMMTISGELGCEVSLPWPIVCGGVSALMTNLYNDVTATLYDSANNVIRQSTITAGQGHQSGKPQDWCPFFWDPIALSANTLYRVGFTGDGNQIGYYDMGIGAADSEGGAYFLATERSGGGWVVNTGRKLFISLSLETALEVEVPIIPSLQCYPTPQACPDPDLLTIWGWNRYIPDRGPLVPWGLPDCTPILRPPCTIPTLEEEASRPWYRLVDVG